MLSSTKEDLELNSLKKTPNKGLQQHAFPMKEKIPSELTIFRKKPKDELPSHQTEKSPLLRKQEPEDSSRDKLNYGPIKSFNKFTPKKSFPTLGNLSKLPKPPLHPSTPTKREKSATGLGVVGSQPINLMPSFNKAIFPSPLATKLQFGSAATKPSFTPKKKRALESPIATEIKTPLKQKKNPQTPSPQHETRKRHTKSIEQEGSPTSKRRLDSESGQEQSTKPPCMISVSNEALESKVADRQKNYLKSICEIIDYMRNAHHEQEKQKVQTKDQDLLATELLHDCTSLLITCMTVPDLESS